MLNCYFHQIRTSVVQMDDAYIFHEKAGIFNCLSMSSIRSSYRRNNNKQQDTNEFLVSLLDKIADCDVANNIEKILYRSIRITNIMSKIFKFYIKSTIHCNKTSAIKLR